MQGGRVSLSLLIGNKFDIIKNNQKKEQTNMSTDPILPLRLATDHYNVSREEFINTIDKVWKANTLFYNQALAHYDQIQKDMADYARLSGNAI